MFSLSPNLTLGSSGPSFRSQLVTRLKANGGWLWDFTDSSKLFQDTAGTTPVTAVNDPIGRANDIIQGTILQQASGTSRPLYKGTAGGLFDGSNDSLASSAAIDLTATDAVMVIAGVRKLSDAAFGCLTEFSTSVSTNNGSFFLFAPAAVSASYGFSSKGTVAAAASYTNAAVAAPNTCVLSGQGDISADTSLLRVNGVQVGSQATDQGTGNYGNYTLYVGRRGGSTFPLNGYLTGLCIVPYIDATTLSLAEQLFGQLNAGLP